MMVVDLDDAYGVFDGQLFQGGGGMALDAYHPRHLQPSPVVVLGGGMRRAGTPDASSFNPYYVVQQQQKTGIPSSSSAFPYL